MKILIIVPSYICSLGSEQIKKLLVELAKSLLKTIILMNKSLPAWLDDNIVALSNYNALIFAKIYKIPFDKIIANKNSDIIIKNIYKEMLALKLEAIF